MRARNIGRLVAGAVALVAVAGCDQTQSPPTTVVVNTPPDGGPVVLLTVMIGIAFLALGAAVVCGWNWAFERRARREVEVALREAEDAVLALTGQPIALVRPALFGSGRSGSWQQSEGRALGERWSQ